MRNVISANEPSASPQRKRGCLFQIGRGLLVLVIVIVALNVLGIVYQQVAEASDRQAYPAPGQLVDIGGFSLHIHCLGEGSPTVILESGTGGSSLDWSLVHPVIAETTRVCAYDRQGYGWSDNGTHPRTSQQVAADLHTLLTRAGIESPYVMVGHSIGAIHVQAYVDQYSDEVAGVVLVDRAPAEMNVVLSDEQMVKDAGQGNLDIPRLLNVIGLARALNFAPSPVAQDLPSELQALYKQSIFQTRYYAAIKEEMAIQTYPANLRYGAALPDFSGDLPLALLFSDPNTYSDPLIEEIYASRMAYAVRYPNAQVITAEGSNHFIMVQRPDVVIQAVQDVVEAARTGEPLIR